jgi:hypothetical protein
MTEERDSPSDQPDPDESGRDDPAADGLPEHVTGHVVVRETSGLPVAGLRGRALALRSALPQLARNPVVVGASAAVATVAVRVAVDVARRALGAPGAAATPTSLTITGSVVHQVHVVRHVHVFHHHPYPVSWWPPPPPR